MSLSISGENTGTTAVIPVFSLNAALTSGSKAIAACKLAREILVLTTGIPGYKAGGVLNAVDQAHAVLTLNARVITLGWISRIHQVARWYAAGGWI